MNMKDLESVRASFSSKPLGDESMETYVVAGKLANTET